MSDAPSIAEELERKVSETLSEALRAASTGIVSPDVTKGILKALWGCSAGLVTKDLMELIADSVDALDEQRSVPRRHALVKGDRTMIITLPDEFNPDGQIVVTRSGEVRNSPINVSDDTLNETSRRAQKLYEGALSSGYKEIT